ncbi:hypothetical protein GY45DRAFT_1320339 [Cubamyces sp. BRFM 1775]|nr:hypothetical protein GY45DRAFT_1320339 [Cubamyces sp. BRFM 1775]
MANPSDLPAGAPVPPEETSAVPRTPLPRTPSPTGFRELHVDPQDDSQTTSEQETAQDTLSVPNQPLPLNDASPAGKKSYYQSRNYASVQQPDVTEKRRKLRLSMSGKSIIVEYDEFMGWFVPAPPGEEEPTDKMKSVDLRGVATTPERKMYKPLVYADTDEKIDAGLYRRSDVAMVGKKTRWAYMELSIECKTEDVQHDPFDESNASGDHEDTSADRKDILGQIMCYSGYIFDYQRRTHHYTLIIFGRMVRIIRWDRAGVVATKPFDYVAHPELLLCFIWRFARMTPAQRGHDPTATRISRDSALGKLMLERAQPPKPQAAGPGVPTDKVDQKHPQECTQATTASPQTTSQPTTTPAQPTSIPGQPTTTPARPAIPGDHPRAAFEKSLKGAATIWWRLRVDDAKGPRYFLVGKTHFRASGLAGRGTQTFIAIDEADPYGPFVYLKDAWRVAHTGIEQEGKILERLNSDDDGGPVPNVPTVRCHGDVDNQVTRSQEIWRLKNKDKLDEECPLKTHRHYRLVVNEVGKPLSEFKNMEELVGLILLSISAHGEAYERKGLIHRDISAGNILICPQLVRSEDGTVEEIATPLLADWELAKRVNDPDEKARQPDRTGTWQFMSASALSHPAKRILVQDDMESFFHLLVYYAIRFLPHNCADVGRFMDLYFDGHEDLNGVVYGGEKKLNTMVHGKLTVHEGTPLCFHLPRQDPPDPKSPTKIIPCPECAPPLPTGHGNPKAPPPPTSSKSSKKEKPPKKPSVPHPINILIKEFLRRLSAHYVLYVERKSKTSSKPSALSEEKLRKKLAQGLGLGVMALASKHKLTFSLKPDTAPELTPLTPDAKAKLEVLAAELGDHTAMRQLFYNHWVGEWPSHDRCKDQLPSNYQPIDNRKKRGADSTWETSDHSAKRSRASMR